MSAASASHLQGAPEARLLVVEDDANIVELLGASLRYAGFEVHTARSGDEALTRARAVPPGLIVLDVMLPGIDGFEVVRRLGPATQRCPVLSAGEHGRGLDHDQWPESRSTHDGCLTFAS